ncbi:MAG: hypothetical protein JEY97_00135 [Bacteroidales bacterium]|nr:hypothetical protein [Bacteroidales bacterium]
MKKTLILLLFLTLYWFPASTQTTFWEDDFEINSGWSLDKNWRITEDALQLSVDSLMFDFDVSAISPIISVPDDPQFIVLSQCLEIFDPSVTTEKAVISIIHNGNEDILWSYDLINGNWGNYNGDEITFSINDYAGLDIQLRFRSFGPTNNSWIMWRTFYVYLTSYFDNDLTIVSFDGQNNIDLNQAGTWEVEVKNLGLETQSNYNIELYSLKSNDCLYSTTISDELAAGETETVSLSWTPTQVQNTIIYAKVILSGDEFEGNDMSPNHFLRIEPEFDYNILVWDNDNGIPMIVDPENGSLIQGHEGITKSLNRAGITYDFVQALPDDISNYDIVLATMGCYCLS